MKSLFNKLLMSTLFIVGSQVYAFETVEINTTNKTALLDGNCVNDEWNIATKIDLSAGVSIKLMHDKDYFYICVKGKPEDITVLDLYIQHPVTDALHRFHLSAQMGESVLAENEWEGTAKKWDLRGYAGFWVPYSGLKDRENRKGPIFERGTHRQVQISRDKFPGNLWNMMFGVSAIKHEDKHISLSYPEKAVITDSSTWQKFSFPK